MLGGEYLVKEVRDILRQDLLSDKNILQNLQTYFLNNELLDEEDLDHEHVFTLAEIRTLCSHYRLRFLDSEHYKPDIPEEAQDRIQYLNYRFRKNLKHFKLLGTSQSFSNHTGKECLLLAKTNRDNYYLIHRWGTAYKWNRSLFNWPLRKFENLVICVCIFTLILTLCLPTAFISLDEHVGYFSGFRVAAFFHLLIFNFGFTAYITFAFNQNFSEVIWDKD